MSSKQFAVPYLYLPASSAQTGSVLETVVAANAQYNSGMNTVGIAKNNLVTYNGNQYIGYGDSGGRVSIIKRNLSTGTIVKTQLSSFLSLGNDEHNIVAISVDNNGFLHICFGMHDVALKYYKSINPEDPTSWSGPLSMLGTNESSVTYPMWIKNPMSGELYFTFRSGASGNGNQFFYHYNTTTSSWEAALGTGSQGLLVSLEPSHSAYLNGLPKWDASAKRLYWNWSWDTTGVNQFLVYWDGASWFQFGGTPQTIPVTSSNLNPVVSVATSVVQNDFNVDSGGVIYIAYQAPDAGNSYQIYVAESSTGSFVVHQITTNIAGVVNNDCEPVVLPIGGSVYIVYPDSFGPTRGLAVIKSSDKFSSWSKFYLTNRYNPNWTLNYDPSVFPLVVSFLFMDSNDPQYGISYLNTSANNNLNLGQLVLINWHPDAGSTNGVPTELYGLGTIGSNLLDTGGILLSNTDPIAAAGRLGLGPITLPTASAGGGQAVPATVLGYLRANLGGTVIKIPYFSA